MRALIVTILLGCVTLTRAQVESPFSEPAEALVGELFMVAVYPSKGKSHWKAMADTINKYRIGGVIVFGGTVEEVANCIRYLRTNVRHRLLIAMDVEWGVAMRVRGVPALPKAVALGAVRDSFLVRLAGWLTGYQCRVLGVDIALAPVVDVNSNPHNPVIGVRSWGSDPLWVARATGWFVDGLRSAGVIPCIKHFPGHGDTNEDSHLQLAVVRAPRPVLDSVHLYPFRHHIARGTEMVMVGHIWAPALDSVCRPATLSPTVIKGVLRKELNFRGVVISDAFNMGGLSVKDHNKAVVQALAAGVDIVLMPANVEKAWRGVLAALTEGRLNPEEIYQSVVRVRQLKQTVRDTYTLPPADSVRMLLNADWVSWSITKLAEGALTAIGGCPPLLSRDEKIVIVGRAPALANNPAHRHTLQIDWNAVDTISPKGNFVLVLVPEEKNFAGTRFATTSEMVHAAARLSKKALLTVVIGSPFWLSTWEEKTRTLLLAPGEGSVFELAVSRALRGEIPIRGRLPLHLPRMHPEVTTCPAHVTLRTGPPSETTNSIWLADTLSRVIQNAIDSGHFPGCQIVVAHRGQIIFAKSSGTLAGKHSPPVTDSTLYDLASVSKVVSTTLAIMKLYEEGKLTLQDTVGKWLAWLRGTPLATRTIEQLLTHTAGLPAWMPFWRRLTPDTLELFFCAEKDTNFCIRVGRGLFAHRSVRDSLIVWFKTLPVDSASSYRYSDLGFVLLGWIVEEVSGMRLDSFVAQHLYNPLGLRRTLYLPLTEFDTSQIAPTEIDTYFRQSIVWGTVHDPLAALMGGVAGHAGVFATALELAVLGQTILNGGTYGEVSLLADSTVRKFTWWRVPSLRRALGFDHPSTGVQKSSSGCVLSYPLAAGHLGFTGTALWVDPYYELVFVFLSNRTYPSMWANRGGQVRTQLHCLVYRSLRVLLPAEALQALYPDARPPGDN